MKTESGQMIEQSAAAPFKAPRGTPCGPSSSLSARAIANSICKNPHWLLSALLAVAVIPAFRATHLALAVNWQRFFLAYWVGLGVRAIFAATLLCVVGFPLDTTLKPVWFRYRSQRPRFVVGALFAVAMLWEFGPVVGIMVVVDGLMLAEIIDRTQGSLESFSNLVRPIFLPAVYLFFGLVMMFAYNDVVAASKFIGAYDWAFLKMDSYLIPGGTTISQIAHLAASRWPVRVFESLEFVYYGMFGQIGAALLIVAVCSGKREAFRYVGTILIAYYLALALFYLWPSAGPFFTCPDHFAVFPHSLDTYQIQQRAILKAKLLASAYKHFNQVDTDYFVAFPCMHIAQPLIVLWFLRRWRGMAICLIVYDVVLIPAILLLEWHYLVDLIGGVAVAAAAIALNRATTSEKDNREGELR